MIDIMKSFLGSSTVVLHLQALVFLLVSVCCDTALALVSLLVSVCCDTAQALVSLLVSVCWDTAQAFGVLAGVSVL